MLYVVLFLSLDAVPAATDIVSSIDLGISENMRMPTHHFFAESLNDVINRKIALFLAHLRMKNHLEKHIAQFFAHVLLVAFLSGIDKLTTFFN